MRPQGALLTAAPMLVLLAALASSSMASAQARPERLPPTADGIRVGGGLVTGFGGTVGLDIDGTAIDIEDDLLASVGFDGFFEYAFMRYLAVGGRSSFVWWNGDTLQDSDVGRSFLWTLSPFIKGRYPFAIDGLGAEVFALLPLGLTVSAPSSDIAGDLNTAVGFNLSLLAGFALWFTDSLGAYTQLGWQWHWIDHEFREPNPNVDVSSRLNQLRWMLGLTMAL